MTLSRAAAGLLLAGCLLGQQPMAGVPPYREAPASLEGTGKFYHEREIAQVMGFAGAAWLERGSRDAEERPDWLIAEFKLEPWMTVADIGAGSGYVSRRVAPLLVHGKAYAVDLQPQMIALLNDLSKQSGMHAIVPVLASRDHIDLPAESVDLAFMVDVYHELEYPFEVMQSIVRALKPGGRFFVIEYRAEDPSVPIKTLHKMSERQVRLEMHDVPLVWERTSERLPMQHIVIFRKP